MTNENQEEILKLEYESDSSPRWKDFNKGFDDGQKAERKKFKENIKELDLWFGYLDVGSELGDDDGDLGGGGWLRGVRLWKELKKEVLK